MNSQNTKKNICMYETKCYRKNPAHLSEYSHPHLEHILSSWNGTGEFLIPSDLTDTKDVINDQLNIIVKNAILPINNVAKINIADKPKSTNNGVRIDSQDNAFKDEENISNKASERCNVRPVASTSRGTAFGTNDSVEYRESSYSIESPAHDLPSETSHNNMHKKAGHQNGVGNQVKKRKYDEPGPSNVLRCVNDYFSVVVPPGGFATKLEQAAPYNFFLTSVKDSKPTHNEPLSVTFQELLDSSLGELECSAHLNFMVDIGWLLAHYFFTDNNGKPMLVLYGEDTQELREVGSRCPYVTAQKVQMSSPFGKHHTKMSLFGYTDGSMRVVISTANLYEPDWENRTQGLWISPRLPPSDVNGDMQYGDSPTGFRDDLLRYLISYKIGHLQSWIARIRTTDFSAVNVFLVCSIPGGHRGIDQTRYGHTRMASLLSKHCKAAPSDPIIAQSSSIGSLGPTMHSWACGEFLNSMSRTANPRSLQSPPALKMIYPSLQNVKRSHDGMLGGGCLPYSQNIHAKQPWLMTILHQWRSQLRNRTSAIPHIKTYCRLAGGPAKPTGLHWFLLTSGNFSKAAWGCLNKGKLDPALRIMSYEAGVLFLPRFITNTDTLSLKQDGLIPAFPMPYDFPLTPYATDDSPFFYEYLTS